MQSDWTKWLAVISCDENAWKVSSFHFIFNSILILVRLQLLRTFKALHPMGNLVEMFFLLLAIRHCDPVISSKNICDQTILQSNCLKAFLVITQEQEFSQIQDLHSNIDSNINFYWSTFLAKPNDNFLKK